MSVSEVAEKPLTPDFLDFEKNGGANGAAPETGDIKASLEDNVVTLTQSKIDEIVREAMGRASKDLRKENAQLKKEREELVKERDAAIKAASPNATELEKEKLQSQAKDRRIAELETERDREKT